VDKTYSWYIKNVKNNDIILCGLETGVVPHSFSKEQYDNTYLYYRDDILNAERNGLYFS